MPRKERSRLTLSAHAISRYYERGGIKKPRRAAIEQRLFGLLRDGVTVRGDLAVLVPWEGFLWVSVPDATGGWRAVTALKVESEREASA